MADETKPESISSFFVDEAGDLTLFNRRGKSLLRHEGVSEYFMVGVAQIPNLPLVSNRLTVLREELLNDPYFKGIPSMQLESRKTAIAFHAKDDLPEVRREVFRLLPIFDSRVSVAIRRKEALIKEAMALFESGGRKLKANDVYDSLIGCIFSGLQRAVDPTTIVFAHRGKSARRDAVENAIRNSRGFANVEPKNECTPLIEVQSGYPSDHSGLQVIDYYLWSLQRMYERREDRFYNLLKDGFVSIRDLDDPKEGADGALYNERNGLTLEKIKSPKVD